MATIPESSPCIDYSPGCQTPSIGLEKPYITEKRTQIDFDEICTYLKSKEISCKKFGYSLDKSVQNKDYYFAGLRLSQDGKKLILFNLKPKGLLEEEVVIPDDHPTFKENADSHLNNQRRNAVFSKFDDSHKK